MYKYTHIKWYKLHKNEIKRPKVLTKMNENDNYILTNKKRFLKNKQTEVYKC